MEEIAVKKYVDGIVGINTALGRLDVLRLYLKDDKMAVTIVDAIIEDLSKTIGNNTFKKINIELPVQKQDIKKTEPIMVNVVEEPEQRVNNSIATAITSIDSKNDKFSTGVEVDNNKYTYKFINSNALEYMIYNRGEKELTMTFKNNGRTYKYYNVPIYMFDNLVSLDEHNGSAGAYFQQNIVRKWRANQYEEITDSMLIG